MSLEGRKCPHPDVLPSQKGKIPSSALPAVVLLRSKEGFQGNFTGDYKFIEIFVDLLGSTFIRNG